MKISIINSYPSNTGDLALLEATVFGLRNRFKGCEISVHVNPLGLEYAKYLNLNVSLDYEYSMFEERRSTMQSLVKRVVRKLVGTTFVIRNNLLPTTAQKTYLSKMRESDLIISGAGSYLNDIYDIKPRLAVFEMLRKKTDFNLVFLSQSIGPYFYDSTKKEIKRIFDSCRLLILREHYSRKVFSNSKTLVAYDICFLLAHKYKFAPKPIKKVQSVVISFREWEGLDSTKITFLLRYLMIDLALEVTFLSTCQGIIGYRDDSRFMQELVNENEFLKSLKINSDYNNPEELLGLYRTFDAYIGMRLHGALLSLIAGTPAFCISYEHKSKGIFEMLQFNDYEISHIESRETWKSKVIKFLVDTESIQKKLPKLIDRASEAAWENLNYLE